MDELQQNRYDQLIRRVGGLIGPGSKVNTALSELFPVIDVERVPGELLALMGTQLAWGEAGQAAVAAQNSEAQIFNPVDSGKLIVVTSLKVRALAATPVSIFLTALPLASLLVSGRFRDGRNNISQQPTAELRSRTIAAAVSVGYRLIAGTTAVFVPAENTVAVLPPGIGLTANANTVNIQLELAFTWRERAAEPSELNF